MRRVSAGEERARESAAALIVPRRATATNACIDPTGGSLRTLRAPLIVHCSNLRRQSRRARKKEPSEERVEGSLTELDLRRGARERPRPCSAILRFAAIAKSLFAHATF